MTNNKLSEFDKLVKKMEEDSLKNSNSSSNSFYKTNSNVDLSSRLLLPMAIVFLAMALSSVILIASAYISKEITINGIHILNQSQSTK